MKRGRLIAFEGGEASGKSTQAALLAERLGALLTREPGGTALGGKIRVLVLDRSSGSVAPWAEAMLMAADRAQHVAEVIAPALAQGRDVVTDRFSGSTLAYQGYGRGLDLDALRQLSELAAGGVEPDLVVLLDVAAGIAGARRTRHPDRMEAESDDFHRRVGDGYRELAAADPARWIVVDGAGSIVDVADRVLVAVKERLS